MAKIKAEVDVDLSEIDDEDLIEELELRDYVVYDNNNDPEQMEVSDFDTDELINELTDRDYHIFDKDGECVSNEAMENMYNVLPPSYTIKRCFDRHQLRSHLENIAGCGGYVSNEELLEQLKYLLENG